MRFLHFVCHLGLVLSIAGTGDCVRRYVGLGRVAELYEATVTPPHVEKAYENVMVGHPRADFAIKMHRGQESRIRTLTEGQIELLRTFQDSLRIQGILFGMLVALFGVITLRLGGSNKALQSDAPRPAGSGRA